MRAGLDGDMSLCIRGTERYTLLGWPGEQESSGEAAEGADGEGLGPCGFQDLNQDLNRCLLFPPGWAASQGLAWGLDTGWFPVG